MTVRSFFGIGHTGGAFISSIESVALPALSDGKTVPAGRPGHRLDSSTDFQ